MYLLKYAKGNSFLEFTDDVIYDLMLKADSVDRENGLFEWPLNGPSKIMEIVQ